MQATSDYKNQHLFQELIRCVIMIVGVMKKKRMDSTLCFQPYYMYLFGNGRVGMVYDILYTITYGNTRQIWRHYPSQ